jgi:hypothetical protein
VFAIAALAAVPVGAQAVCTAPACPHIYENGAQAAEAKKVRQIAWGTTKLKNAALGEVECHNIVAGYLENPVGGGPATGFVQAWVPYECVSPSCIALGGKAIKVLAGDLPWRAEIFEPESGVFRQKTGLRGFPLKPPKGEFVEFKVICEGATEGRFVPESNPKILNNGLSIGALPTEEEWTPGAPGESVLESELGEGEPAGKVKTEGYSNQALLEVHNP